MSGKKRKSAFCINVGMLGNTFDRTSKKVRCYRCIITRSRFAESIRQS